MVPGPPMAELSGLAGEIADAIGEDQTLILLKWYGGTQINIPKRAEGSKLADVLGDVDAARLIHALGHGRLNLPLGPSRGLAGRRTRALQLLADGMSVAQVARICDLHMRTVANYRGQMAQEDGRQMQLPFG